MLDSLIHSQEPAFAINLDEHNLQLVHTTRVYVALDMCIPVCQW